MQKVDSLQSTFLLNFFNLFVISAIKSPRNSQISRIFNFSHFLKFIILKFQATSAFYTTIKSFIKNDLLIEKTIDLDLELARKKYKHLDISSENDDTDTNFENRSNLADGEAENENDGTFVSLFNPKDVKRADFSQDNEVSINPALIRGLVAQRNQYNPDKIFNEILKKLDQYLFLANYYGPFLETMMLIIRQKMSPCSSETNNNL